ADAPGRFRRGRCGRRFARRRIEGRSACTRRASPDGRRSGCTVAAGPQESAAPPFLYLRESRSRPRGREASPANAVGPRTPPSSPASGRCVSYSAARVRGVRDEVHPSGGLDREAGAERALGVADVDGGGGGGYLDAVRGV